MFRLLPVLLLPALLCSSLVSRASSPGAVHPQAAGGMTLSLSTSAYHFTPYIGSVIGGGNVDTSKETIAVSVALLNRTNEDITFEFPTPDAAERHFVFRVYNSDGVLVWDSTAGVISPQHVVDATLQAHHGWHASARVPIFYNGMPLPPGAYTVTARLETVPGTSEFQSTATFVVRNLIAY